MKLDFSPISGHIGHYWPLGQLLAAFTGPKKYSSSYISWASLSCTARAVHELFISCFTRCMSCSPNSWAVHPTPKSGTLFQPKASWPHNLSESEWPTTLARGGHLQQLMKLELHELELFYVVHEQLNSSWIIARAIILWAGAVLQLLDLKVQ